MCERVCVSQIGLIFCWLSAEMPDNIDLVAEVSGRSVWLLSNQSDYTHKHASTHTYKKNSIRATDSVIDFPVYLCVGQCRLMAHILYFNGCVSFHVSWNYCFFLTEDLKWSLWGLVLIPSVPANSSMWLLSWKELACACLFLTDSIRQLSRCSICQSVTKKKLEFNALASSSYCLSRLSWLGSGFACIQLWTSDS